MAWPWPYRLLWGCNPSWLDTATAHSPGVFRTLRNVVVDPSGGYVPGWASWGSGAIGFAAGSPAVEYGPQPIEEDINYAAKWPRFVPDGLNLMMGSRFWMDANPSRIEPVFLALNASEGYCQMSLCIDTSGYISVWRGLPFATHPLHEELWNSSTVGVAVSPSAFHRLGWILNLASVNGWFDVYLDQVHLVFAGGLLTHVHGAIPWGGVGFGGDDGMKHSHMFVGSGIPEYNARIRRGGFLSIPGDPIADGTYTGGVSTEATNYEAIDESPTDDATTRIDLQSLGEKYSIRREDLVGTRTVLGVQNTVRFSRPEDSPYSLRQFIAVNDVIYPANTLAADAPGVWSWDQVLAVTDPSTSGLPFTRARLNSETVTTEHGALVHGSVSA